MQAAVNVSVHVQVEQTGLQQQHLQHRADDVSVLDEAH